MDKAKLADSEDIIVVEGGDGKTDDTEAIQAAIDQAQECKRQDCPETQP